jgi:hypothetical protein
MLNHLMAIWIQIFLPYPLTIVRNPPYNQMFREKQISAHRVKF